jgi:hypothetical protein
VTRTGRRGTSRSRGRGSGMAEDLNVAAMTRNRRLARAITGQGLGLRHGENQAGPVRADLPARRLRPGHRPGRERRP